MSPNAFREGRPRRDKGSAGHRISAGSLRIVEDGAGAWLLAPAKVPLSKPSSGNHVGRVGALAVALGVGGFLVGFPAAAAADTRSGEDSVTQPSDSLTSSSPAVVARDSRSRARAAERGAPASRADSEAATAGKRSAQDSVRSSTEIDTNTDNKGSDSSPVTPSAGTSAVTPEVATIATTKLVPSTAVQTDAPTSTVAQSAASSEAVQSAVRAAQPTASAPVATVASGQVAAGSTDISTALGGDGDPLTALLTPLAWAAASVSRRETAGSAATTTVAGAAASVADVDADVAALGLTADDIDTTAFREVITQVLTGMKAFVDVVTPLMNRESSGNPIHDILNVILEAGGEFVTRPEVQAQLGEGAAGIVKMVAADPELRAQISSGLRNALPTLLNNDTVLAGAVADAAEALLADPDVSAAFATIVGAGAKSYLSHLSIPQVGTVITGAVLQIADALTITGTDPLVPVQTALNVLVADPVVMAAFNAATAETVAAYDAVMKANPQVAKVIGEVTAKLIGTTVTGSPDALGQAAVDLIKTATTDPALANAVEAGLGPVLGPAMAGLLRNADAMAAISDVVGTAMNALLSYPGASDALSTVIPALLASSQNGSDPVASLLGALQDSPALLTALAATVPGIVDSLLGNSALVSAIGGVAESVATGFLHDNGIQLGFLDAGLGSLASVGIESLMSNAAVSRLIGNVVMDFVSGADVNAVINAAIQSVLQNSELQGALGSAVGQALGTTIFGDNGFGDAVGAVAGGLVSVTLGVTAGIALMFTGAGQVSGAAAAVAVAAAAVKAAAANSAKAAAALVAAIGAAASEPAVPDTAFTLLTIQTIVNRLANFPGPSGVPFTTSEKYNVEVSIDAALNNIDYFAAQSLAGNASADIKWLGDLAYLMQTSFTSSIPGYSTKLSDGMRLWASGINKFLPPFQMIVPLLSTKQFVSATVAGIVEVADDPVDGFGSMDGMVGAAISAGVGKFLFPSTALNVTFKTPYADGTPTIWSTVCLLGLMITYNRLHELVPDYWGNSPVSTNNGADALGVVHGYVLSSDASPTFTLAGIGNPTGTTRYEATTANGGVVYLEASGRWNYIPKPGVTSDSFKVKNGSTTLTVSVSSLAGKAPVINVDNTTTLGTTTGKVNLPVEDRDMLLTVGLGTAPTKGTVTVNPDGTFVYVRNPELGHTGGPTDSFTVTLSTPGGRKNVLGTVTVNGSVADNEAPVAGNVTVTTSSLAVSATTSGVEYRKQNTTGTLSATDADNDSLTYTAGTYTTTKGGSVVVTAAGGFTYTSAQRSNAAWHETTAADVDTFTVNISDGFGGITAATYAIPGKKLTANNAPGTTLTYSTIATDALGLRRFTMTGTDLDGDTLTYSLAGAGNPTGATDTGSLSANGALVKLDGNAIIYVPKVGVASDTFKVAISDGYGGTSVATVSMSSMTTPSPVKNISTATPGTVTGALDVPAGDVGMLTYGVGSAPAKGTVTVNADGTFTYVRSSLDHSVGVAADSFTISGSDDQGHTTILATVNVTPVVPNTAPAGGTVTAATNSVVNTATSGTPPVKYYTQTTTGTVAAADADGDAVTFTAGTFATTDGGSVVVAANGTFTYTSKQASNYYWHPANPTVAQRVDKVTLTANDGFGGSSAVEFSIVIPRKNDVPASTVTVSGSATDALGVLRFTIAGTDADADTMTYSLAGAGNPTGATATGSATTGGGIVNLSGDAITYIPTSGVATDSFKVLVTDVYGGTAVATVSLTSLSTPSPTKNIDASVDLRVAGALDVPAADTGLTFSAGSTAPTKGTVTVNADGTFTYLRTEGLPGSVTAADSFTIKATDAAGRSVNIATINVAPSLGNEAPTLVINTAATVGTRTGGVQTATGKITWADADGDALTINGQAAPTGANTISLTSVNGGTMVLKGDGTYVYTRTTTDAVAHAAAKIGAVDSAKNDYVNITLADPSGASNTYAIKVPVYAIGSVPVISNGTRTTLSGTVSAITITDADGDTTPTMTFTASSGTFTFSGLGVNTSKITGGRALSTITLTVKDGYYTVSNGVVSATQVSVSKSW